MLKILKQPKWILLTFALIVAIYAFINLSEWQFNRNDQRKNLNKEISLALSKDPVNVSDATDFNQFVQWQPVQISGEIDRQNIRFARNRYLESNLGFWVIAPLKINGDQMVLINLGFIPINFQNRFNELSLPAGIIKYEGWIRKLEKHRVTPNDYPEFQISSISYQNFTGNINENIYIQIKNSSLDLKDIQFLPQPTLSSGPHFSYAIQWIIFAVLLPIGWIILFREEKTK
jgi:cytochrome oxidase assembly protein ShyY1